MKVKEPGRLQEHVKVQDLGRGKELGIRQDSMGGGIEWGRA